MSRLVGAELFKLRTTRTGIALLASAVVLVALISALATLTGDFDSGNFGARELLDISGFAQLFALVLGILAVTTEFRHGTITPTLLAAPVRARVLAAKLAAHLLAGFVLALVAVAAGTAIVLGVLEARGIPTGLRGADVQGIVLGQSLAGGLWAAIGVGLGAVVRNQVGAIIGGLAYTFVIEQLVAIVPGVGDAVQKYGLNGTTNALADVGTANGGEVLAQLPGGLLLTAYAAAFALSGTLVLRRVDVTS